MAEVFHLPAVGDTMVEGEIVEWLVAVGDTVALDQPICSVETDKSVVELTSPHRGTVLALGGQPGDVLEVGAPLLVVGEPGEPVPPLDTGPAADSAGAGAGAGVGAGAGAGRILSPLVRRLVDQTGVDVATIVGTGPGGRITRADVELAAAGAPTALSGASLPLSSSANGTVLAMPKVRRAARQRGLDLTALSGSGSGPRGSITLADLDRTPGRSRPPAGGGERRERLSALRRSIADHLITSVQTVPQFTSMVEVDATALLATRDALRQRLDRPVPIDAVLMAVLLPVVRDHPIVNATLDGDEIVYHGHYDIGVAVDTPDG